MSKRVRTHTSHPGIEASACSENFAVGVNAFTFRSAERGMLKMISSSSKSAVATGITLVGVDFAYFASIWEIEYLERERGYS
jgi:hypothetical protein